jgi:hypothetical protein
MRHPEDTQWLNIGTNENIYIIVMTLHTGSKYSQEGNNIKL